MSFTHLVTKAPFIALAGQIDPGFHLLHNCIIRSDKIQGTFNVHPLNVRLGRLTKFDFPTVVKIFCMLLSTFSIPACIEIFEAKMCLSTRCIYECQSYDTEGFI